MTNIYGDFNGEMLKVQRRQAKALEQIAEHLEKISVVLGRATEKPDLDFKVKGMQVEVDDEPIEVDQEYVAGLRKNQGMTWAEAEARHEAQLTRQEAQLDVVEFLHDTIKLGDKSVGLQLGALYVDYQRWANKSHKGFVSINEFRRIVGGYYPIHDIVSANMSVDECVMGLVRK